MLNKVVIFDSLCKKKYSRKLHNITVEITDVTWTILTMFLLPFWALNVSVALLSMQGQRALGFHQNYLDLCFKDEGRSYGFGTT